jgi:competence protein ComGC
MTLKLNQNSETALENIIVLIFIFVFTVIMIHKYYAFTEFAKKAEFIKEIHELNLALISYRVKYKKFPKNLSVLTKKGYIKNIKTDDRDYPITPFGKRFVYKRKYGKVLK